MSIGEKLLTIAENEKKVFETGKLGLLKNSKYTKGTKSGSPVIITDCSPVEHDLSVKVKAIEISTNNLLTTPYTVSYENDGGMIYKSNGTSINISGESTDASSGVAINHNFDFSQLEHGKTYYLGLIYVKGDILNNPLSLGFYCSGGSNVGQYGVSSIVWDSGWNSNFFVCIGETGINYDCEVIPVLSTEPLGSGGTGLVLGDISITITGTNAETKTVKANADGTVEGLKSSYPDFTLTSDTEGVIIQCGYYKDIDKTCEDSYEKGYEQGKSEGGDTEEAYNNGFEAGKKSEYDMFWDNYQNFGNRTDYARAFSNEGWTIDTFRPKYDIVDTSGYMTFRNSQIAVDLVEYLNNLGVKFIANITGNPTQMFMGSDFTRIGEISFGKCTLTQTFSGCTNLETIDKIISSSDTKYENTTFGTCPNLKNITFEGEINTAISFSSCKLLTHDSLMSIINHLSTTTTTKTLTLHADSKALLSDAEKAIATQKGWTIA